MLPDPLHPALVHFPIVLGVLAPLVCLGALWAVRSGVRTRPAWAVAVALAGALVAASWLAIETGEQEEERVEEVVAEAAIEDHEHAAERFLWVGLAVFAMAIAGLAPGRLGSHARLLATVGSFALVAAGWQVGRLGGALVYEHGAANAYLNAEGSIQGSPPASSRGENGRDHDEDDDDHNH